MLDAIPEDPVDGRNGWNGGRITDPLVYQLIPDLPGEEGRMLCLQPYDPLHYRGCGHLLLNK